MTAHSISNTNQNANNPGKADYKPFIHVPPLQQHARYEKIYDEERSKKDNIPLRNRHIQGLADILNEWTFPYANASWNSRKKLLNITILTDVYQATRQKFNTKLQIVWNYAQQKIADKKINIAMFEAINCLLTLTVEVIDELKKTHIEEEKPNIFAQNQTLDQIVQKELERFDTLKKTDCLIAIIYSNLNSNIKKRGISEYTFTKKFLNKNYPLGVAQFDGLEIPVSVPTRRKPHYSTVQGTSRHFKHDIQAHIIDIMFGFFENPQTPHVILIEEMQKCLERAEQFRALNLINENKYNIILYALFLLTHEYSPAKKTLNLYEHADSVYNKIILKKLRQTPTANQEDSRYGSQSYKRTLRDHVQYLKKTTDTDGSSFLPQIEYTTDKGYKESRPYPIAVITKNTQPPTQTEDGEPQELIFTEEDEVNLDGRIAKIIVKDQEEFDYFIHIYPTLPHIQKQAENDIDFKDRLLKLPEHLAIQNTEDIVHIERAKQSNSYLACEFRKILMQDRVEKGFKNFFDQFKTIDLELKKLEQQSMVSKNS